MIGTFDAENLRKFMDDFINGKTPLFNVSLSDGDFQKSNCENIHDQKIDNGIQINKIKRMIQY